MLRKVNQSIVFDHVGQKFDVDLAICEAIFYPFISGLMKWLYSEIHMLLVKEKMQNVSLNIKLCL